MAEQNGLSAEFMAPVTQTEGLLWAQVESTLVRHEFEQGKALLCTYNQQFLGHSMHHCYVEHRRSMRLHPTPSHRGLWWAAILVKPMSVCTGGFTTAPFPYSSSPCCSSSLLKYQDKPQFTVSECWSHVDECGYKQISIIN